MSRYALHGSPVILWVMTGQGIRHIKWWGPTLATFKKIFTSDVHPLMVGT